MMSEKLMAMEERTRRAELITALGSWFAGGVVAVASALVMSAGAHPRRASIMDWSVDGTENPVEVDGTLVMPEDRIVSHRPITHGHGVAEMQAR